MKMTSLFKTVLIIDSLKVKVKIQIKHLTQLVFIYINALWKNYLKIEYSYKQITIPFLTNASSLNTECKPMQQNNW